MSQPFAGALRGRLGRLRRARPDVATRDAGIDSLDELPGCSFLVVVFPGEASLMRRTAASLSEQWWRRWHAVLLTAPHSDSPPQSADLRVAFQVAGDVGTAVNAAVNASDADFVVFLDAGDQLAHRCLLQVMREAHREPLLDLAYWDDALTSAHGNRRYRPGWSPDMLLSGNYLGNAFAVRRRCVVAAGGVRSGAGPAMLWDLLLRASVDGERAIRLPRVLSYRMGCSELAGEQGRSAVQDECRRRGIEAEAVRADGAVQLRWRLAQPPGVSIVVPSRHNRPLLERLFAGLRATDYPEFEVIVVDNGGSTPEREGWYTAQGLPLRVVWWDAPFNYSAVNNAGAALATGDVFVFLNDDIEVLDPSWLRELTGWLSLDGIGEVGMQLLDARGLIQHGGVVVGVSGFAGHLFQGMRPGAESLLGSTRWHRNVLAVTGACAAIHRDRFAEVGGFDERFILCGSDVALGLSLHLRGYRNVCTSFNGLRHLESATRGTDIPAEDFHMSYWLYQPWLRGGDPYYSPALSPVSGVPRPRAELDPNALDVVGTVLGRRFGVFRSASDLERSGDYAARYRATAADECAVRELHMRNREPFQVRSVNWFIPGLDSPFYGGINTALRIADQLAREHGVFNRFVVMDRGPELYFRSGIAAAFPDLRRSAVEIVDSPFLIDTAPEADVAIATLWTTAYDVARFPGARRKFYLIQDFEPMFYPAGTLYALAEESYRLGLYGLCNTDTLAQIYANDYAGSATPFTPAVDTDVFHARGRARPRRDGPVTVFVYARPGHWRNCWELAYPALVEVKERLGDRVRIVAAGSWAIPDDRGLHPCIHQLGLLDYRATGRLYRSCDIGLALTVSAHPSYLPLELMSCGAAVVAFDNAHGHWLLKHEQNCLLTPRTVDGLADAVERLVLNPPLRRRLADGGLETIRLGHSDWSSALSGIYRYLCDPESANVRDGVS